MKLLICLLPLLAQAMADDASTQKLLVDGNNQFTAKLFSEVAKNNVGKSVVMSGFSALSPLAQLGLASVGDSHDEILKTIGMPNDEATKDAFTLVNGNLRSAKGVELKVANRIYIPNNGELNGTFAQMSRDVFSSDVKNVDFAKNVEAAAAINAWVEDNTNKRIKDLVSPDSLGEDTRAVLVNAIYFKGTWEEQFDKALTKDKDFHVSKDKTIQVPTMFKNGNFKYGTSQELDAQLLELYYEGGDSAFLIVLPNKVDGLAELEEKIKDPSALAKAVENMYNTDVDVFLPKFKIETTIDLKDVLLKIGVTKLFSPKDARLEYLLKGEGDGLYVSNAIQKAFIEVNEEGAEAAAASAYYVDRIDSVDDISIPITFKADHPFIFILKHYETSLFTGMVLF
ncbi:antichymotrypsin-2-like isoform X6 [Ostrinia furnacalis]|uniref:antichymotrypsin-2-like isoform X6 n=1 Tax=Ostrinia furnacalis TaxID=93504 RepID=UPI001038CF64|nr:antichymotrypsin-2-like isoform X6 [Ostrinia furnacalis]XP_028157725.1 antichymotrypsin-2-like isoform X6 [Ostrinia furnacalis]